MGPYEKMLNKINNVDNQGRGLAPMLVECKPVKNPPMIGYKQTYTENELLEVP